MTLYAFRIEEPNYSIYEFLEEMHLGHKTFQDMDELKEYIKHNMFNDSDTLLHPESMAFSNEDFLYLFIVDTQNDMNWIIKADITLTVAHVEINEVDNAGKK